MVKGVVKFYKVEKGWGAISSDALPAAADAWVHFSVIEGTGYRELAAGDVVEFDFEAVEQDSFRFRATRVKRLRGGPAPTLRRRGDEVRIEPEGVPDTPLVP
ncbi:cold-shock protein [Microlunatus antarcticus]|uniref:CspA family cold shock protein n=1 Tax=Microlunatus antarcticus TaxID=53388 RepID=A0A7W5JXJ6_9ACTN|nr:CspA family cold shock protein [Microlunatus antarcticus]